MEQQLIDAVFMGDIEPVRQLISSGAAITERVFKMSIIRGFSDIIMLLIHSGADVTASDHMAIKMSTCPEWSAIRSLLMEAMYDHPQYRYKFDECGILYIFDKINATTWCDGRANAAFVESCLPELCRKKSAR
jgi:hypothetical protein